MFRNRIVRDDNDRGNSSSELIFTAGKVRLFLTVEFIGLNGELFITVLGISDADVVILFIVNKGSVTTSGESITLDTEDVLDALVRAFNHNIGRHKTGGTVAGVVNESGDGQAGVLVEDGVVNFID